MILWHQKYFFICAFYTFFFFFFFLISFCIDIFILFIFSVSHITIRVDTRVEGIHREAKRNGWRRENKVEFSERYTFCGRNRAAMTLAPTIYFVTGVRRSTPLWYIFLLTLIFWSSRLLILSRLITSFPLNSFYSSYYY